MGYELRGRVVKIYETKQVSEKFSKREFVVETADNPKYPQTVLLQATGDRIGHLDTLSVGDEVRVEFNVRGRAWQDKFFNSLDVWKVERTSEAQNSNTSGGGGSAQDDIPFASCDLADEPSAIAKVLRL